MTTIRTILHPTDFSESSNHAFRLACSLAVDHQSRVVVLHVLERPITVYAGVAMAPPAPPPWPERETARAQLDAIRASDRDLVLEHRLEQGDPAELIPLVAQELACDLIVIGTHGRSGLGRLLMGSVAEKVLRHARCPVLTVKQPSPIEPHNEPITVYTHTDAVRAELIRSALEEAGVPCWLSGIQEASAVGLPGICIHVQVPASSVERARDLIARWEHEPALA